MSILNRIKHFLPISAKLHIYNALILSHLKFGILAWGHQCEWIIKLQNKIVWITSLSKYNAHTEAIFKTLKLLKLTDILKLQELKFHYKYKSYKLPWYHYNLPFVQNTDIHNHLTRAQGNLYMMRPKHTYARYCSRYCIPFIVNKSSPEIIGKIDTHNLQGFS